MAVRSRRRRRPVAEQPDTDATDFVRRRRIGRDAPGQIQPWHHVVRCAEAGGIVGGLERRAAGESRLVPGLRVPCHLSGPAGHAQLLEPQRDGTVDFAAPSGREVGAHNVRDHGVGAPVGRALLREQAALFRISTMWKGFRGRVRSSSSSPA